MISSPAPPSESFCALPRRLLQIVICCLALATSVASSAVGQPSAPETPTVSLEKVADGVYAMLQPAAGRFNDSNSTVIVTESDVIVVDAQADSSAVEAIFRAVRELTDLPVTWLINTHWHADHTQGNALWRELAGDQLRIVGHESLKEDVPTRTRALLDEQIERLQGVLPRAEENLARGQGLEGQELDEQQQEAQRQAIDQGKRQLTELEQAVLLAPDVTYRHVLRLERESGDVVLLHLPGHTDGDTVVWLPRQQVLVTGDLLDEIPFGGHGTPGQIVRSLDHLRGYDAEVVVPGHGGVIRGAERLELAHELWSTLLAHCRQQQQLGRGVEEASEALDVSDLRTRMTGGEPVAERNFDAFLPDNLARACAETSGTLN